jgi:hypothetical protein
LWRSARWSKPRLLRRACARRDAEENDFSKVRSGGRNAGEWTWFAVKFLDRGVRGLRGMLSRILDKEKGAEVSVVEGWYTETTEPMGSGVGIVRDMNGSAATF